MARNIILLVTFVVGGLCFGVIYLAEYDTYERTRDGEHYAGPILKIKKSGIRYLDEASGEEKFLRDPPEDWAARRKVGERIEVGCSVVRCEALDIIAPPSPLLFVPMGVLILIGLAFVVLPVVDRKRLARAGVDPLAVISVLLKKARFQALVGGLLFLAMGGFFVLVMVVDPSSVAGLIVIGFLAVCCVVFGGLLLKRFFGLLDIKNSWILHVIIQRPEEIVWIYEQMVTSRGGLGVNRTVFICMADGRKYPVPLGQTGIDDFIASLTTRATRAVIGYSPELAKAFKDNPASLGDGG